MTYGIEDTELILEAYVVHRNFCKYHLEQLIRGLRDRIDKVRDEER